MDVRVLGFFILLSMFGSIYLSCEDPDATDGLMSALDNVSDAAPSFCEGFCASQSECVLKNAAGENADSWILYNAQRTLDRCELDCALYAERGDFVIKGTLNSSADGDAPFLKREIMKHIPGGVLAEFDQCIWSLGSEHCVAESNGFWELYHLEVGDRENQEQCDKLNACFAVLKDFIDVEAQWMDAEADNAGTEACKTLIRGSSELGADEVVVLHSFLLGTSGF